MDLWCDEGLLVEMREAGGAHRWWIYGVGGPLVELQQVGGGTATRSTMWRLSLVGCGRLWGHRWCIYGEGALVELQQAVGSPLVDLQCGKGHCSSGWGGHCWWIYGVWRAAGGAAAGWGRTPLVDLRCRRAARGATASWGGHHWWCGAEGRWWSCGRLCLDLQGGVFNAGHHYWPSTT
ncbi:hypothetical protein XELAEV_18028952mg [Xenopus laevis]|uniref:Uncharacterized protein n=1 Tax=Xenopus laevis TaxID=8355 RepID=A0A974HH90_XENLA|nr:hypothetical protein XELAEV_18028952mg [Xenopus laevis]